ncbi:MAG: hypothetical protein HWE11_16335 [Gammaproteobacteria bacterium]|nr:hypothetical protein [Gammaproteobacteria bacterium]
MDQTNQNTNFTPSSKLNFVIGICAITISLASFVATYFQAQSEAAQAKAMTYPLIQFTSSNYDMSTNRQILKLQLKNQGVGPALIKKVKYHYKDQDFSNLNDFLQACCKPGMEQFAAQVKQGEFNQSVEYALITSTTAQVILPANDSINALALARHEGNDTLWQALNQERWDLSLSVCYCSLLQQCYVSKGIEDIKEVSDCREF